MARRRRRRRQQQPQCHPNVLTRVYGHRLQTLHHLILHLLAPTLARHPSALDSEAPTQAEPATGPPWTLITPNDPPDFVSLLEDTFAAVTDAAPAPAIFSLENRWTQQEVVQRVIEMQFHKTWRPLHVLCSGYRQPCPSNGNSHQGLALQGLESVFPNTTSEIVTANAWLYLLSRVGDMLMLYLLSHTCIFIPLPNNCYLQVTGYPISLSALSQQTCSTYCLQKNNVSLKRQRKEESKDSDKISAMDSENFDALEAKHKNNRNYDLSTRKISRGGQIGSSTSAEGDDNIFMNSNMAPEREFPAKNQGQFFQGPLAEFPSKKIDLGANSTTDGTQDGLIRASIPEMSVSIDSKLARGLKHGKNLFLKNHLKRCMPREWHSKLEKNQTSKPVLKKPKIYMGRQDAHSTSNHFEGAGTNCEIFTQNVTEKKKLPSHRDGASKEIKLQFKTPFRRSHAMERMQNEHTEVCCHKHFKWQQSNSEKVLQGTQELSSNPRGQVNSRFLQRRCIEADGSGHIYARKFQQDVKHITTSPYWRSKIIDRRPMFYRSKFSRYPGLPENHIIVKSKPNNIGASFLYRNIFKVTEDILAKSPSKEDTVSLSKNKSKSEVEFQQYTLKLLRKLISNARHCQFGRLLRRHCPTPKVQLFDLDNENPTATTMKETKLMTDQAIDVVNVDISLEDGYLTQEELTTSCSSESSPEEIEQVLEKEAVGNMSIDSRKNVHLRFSGNADNHYDIAILEPRDLSGSFDALPTCCGELTRNTAAEGASEERSNHFCEDENARKIVSMQCGSNKTRKDVRMKKHTSALKGHTPLISHHSTLEKDARKPNLLADKANEYSQEHLLSNYTSHSQVVAFLWSVCRRIIPEELLGSHHNWRVLRSGMAHFVGLRRYEAFCLQNCLHKLKVSQFPWLQAGRQGSSKPLAARELILQQKRLEDWLFWIFDSILVPLVWSHFYVTEREGHRQIVFYYRKPIWEAISSLALDDLAKTFYKRLAPTSVTELLSKKILGIPQIRLLPKTNGLRPIAKLGSASKYIVSSNAMVNGKHSFWRKTGKNKQVEHLALAGLHKSSQSVKADENATSSFLTKESVKKVFHFRPVNLVLQDIHQCLKYEQRHHPDDMGFSVFDYNDIYFKLLTFIARMKSHRGLPKLYLAVCDVAKAFDNIKHDKLSDIMKTFVQEQQYFVVRFTSVTPTACSVRVHHERVCTLAGENHNFLELAKTITAKRSCVIFTDQVCFSRIKKEQVLEMIDAHVKRNFLQMGPHFLHQIVGIPQGGVLSPLMCSIYYGHLERNYIVPLLKSDYHQSSFKPQTSASTLHMTCSRTRKVPLSEIPSFCENEAQSILASYFSECNAADPVHDASINKPFLARKSRSGRCALNSRSKSNHGSMQQVYGQLLTPSEQNLVRDDTASASSEFLLMRMIDDSLLISTSKDLVSRFLMRMHKGFEEYGCHVNEHKTCLSFNYQLKENCKFRRTYQTEDGANFMRWNGLMINCHTLEVQADYTRYCGEDIKTTLTVWRSSNPGLHYMQKLCQFMRPKCHPLFYDQRINSLGTVCLNAYQAFMLCAMKSHAYLCSMPLVGCTNARFLFYAILRTARYMHQRMKQKMSAMGDNCTKFLLKQEELEWLGIRAFYTVLLKKQSRYKELLLLLHSGFQAGKYHKMAQQPHLLSAIDEKRSSMFKYVRY